MDSDQIDMMNDAMARIFGGMLGAIAGVGGPDPGLCSEGDWTDHAAGELFRAVRRCDARRVEDLLERGGECEKLADELDGDSGGALHVLGLSDKPTEREAADIVSAFKNAGADLDLRAGRAMSSETPLHAAACYGHYSVIKALLDAGATADISDDFGRTPSSRAEEAPKKGPRVDQENAEKSLALIRKAVEKERSASSNYVDAKIKRAEELRQRGDEQYDDEDWERAAESYSLSIQCNDDDHLAHGKLAAACLEDANERFVTPGRSGYRGLFLRAHEAAARAVEIEPSYETGWRSLARGYLGYRELPRAKKAAMDGLRHFPDSKRLKEIWTVLNYVGVPDGVVDHESREFKDVHRRLYEERWIGEVPCHYCGLSCMSEPRPERCPFCGCPDMEILDEDDEMILFLSIGQSIHDEDGDDGGVDEDGEDDDNDNDIHDNDADGAHDDDERAPESEIAPFSVSLPAMTSMRRVVRAKRPPRKDPQSPNAAGFVFEPSTGSSTGHTNSAGFTFESPGGNSADQSSSAAFASEAKSPSASSTFSFGSPPTAGTTDSSKFVFGSPETKEPSK